MNAQDINAVTSVTANATLSIDTCLELELASTDVSGAFIITDNAMRMYEASASPRVSKSPSKKLPNAN